MSRHPVIDRRAPNELFIECAWSPSSAGKRFAVSCPVTGEKLADASRADADDVDRAADAASRAFHTRWRTVTAGDRAQMLYELANRIAKDADMVDLVDNGSIVRRMRADIDTGLELMRTYAGFTRTIGGRTIPIDEHTLSFTLREPYGVVGVIVPFNHPFMFAAQAKRYRQRACAR